MKKYFIYFLNAGIKVLTGTEPCCRFEVSCSRYFVNALEDKGWIQGSFLGIKRILSCSPIGKSHYDK